MRTTAASASRRRTSRSIQIAWTTQSAGPAPTMITAVALMPPTSSIVNANHAGYRQPPWRSDRAASAMSHGSAAQGSNSTEMRAE
jgi:hypothetical protein